MTASGLRKKLFKSAAASLTVAAGMSLSGCGMNQSSGLATGQPAPALADPGPDGLVQICSRMNPETILYKTTKGGFWGTDYYMVTFEGNDTPYGDHQAHMHITGTTPTLRRVEAEVAKGPWNPVPEVTYASSTPANEYARPASGYEIELAARSVATRASNDAINRNFAGACVPGVIRGIFRFSY